MNARDASRAATAMGLALGCAMLPLVYAVVRVVVARVDPEADPVAVVWSEHSPAITRFMITLYGTGALTAGAIAIARAFPARAPSMVSFASIVSAIALFAMAWFAP